MPEINYQINKPSEINSSEKEAYVNLLSIQGKVSNPTVEKINRCKFLCLVYDQETLIGIGAIKEIYLTPFDKAGVPEEKKNYQYELGYLYVNPNDQYRGRGIGKTICIKLLEKIKHESVFATTVESEANSMYHILLKTGFVKIGKSYIGAETGDTISLFVKSKELF